MAAYTQDLILLLGDSLTQGTWNQSGIAQQLALAYVRKFDVINRGLSGYQTDWAIPVFEQVLAQQHERRHVPKVVLLTIWFGANDAAPPPSPQHVPRDRYEANLIHLISMVKSPTSAYYSPNTRIILITPPPVNTYDRTDRIFAETKVYADVVKAVGTQTGVPVADVWTEIWEAAGCDERACKRFLHDGLHLNAAGYEIVFNLIMKIIEEKYPEIHHERLQTVFVPWTEVDVRAVRPPPPIHSLRPSIWPRQSAFGLDRHSNKRRKRDSEYSRPQVMNFFSTLSSASSHYLSAPLAPIRKRTQHIKPRDDLDDFLSSDLELSFASTMSLNSPSREYVNITRDTSQDDAMDISPMPVRKEPVRFNKPTTRPRAYTSGARMFGQDLSNNNISDDSLPRSGTRSGSKHTQRNGLPAEWFSAKTLEREASDENIFAPPADTISLPSEDAMDVDPTPAVRNDTLLSSPPLSAAPTITGFNMFHSTISLAQLETPSAGAGEPKKRRSLSPDAASRIEQDVPSSPPPSSPSQHKLERMGSGPLLSHFNKPLLQGLGVPSNMNKRPRRPIFSSVVHPAEGCVSSACLVMESEEPPSHGLVAPKLSSSRRVVSAMLPPSGVEMSDESFDGPDMSSPAQAYIKRQQTKTIRRRDGTEDFRPLTGASPKVNKDVYESPSSKFMLAGFGDNESLGKILPCHRVREDGLMRIDPNILDALLDGAYSTQIAQFHVIDCRFEYEFNGGHIPGAININTTAGIEEFLHAQSRPKPCVSGDVSRKTVLIFHCEFSVKRAPTIAKHLRSKDRAMNNHVYPKIHYPEVYILEGGYCAYYKHSGNRCQPQAYVTMDDPSHALSRREDLDQFRKAKFGRTKSYAYGDLGSKVSVMTQQQSKRNTAPGTSQLFAAANAARTRRNGLSTLAEFGNVGTNDDEETDIGDSPCPPPTKGVSSKVKRLVRTPVARAETFDAARMAAY